MPDQLTQQVNNHLSCMQGTANKPARCTALLGDIGNSVRCTIYESRSSTCREFNTHDAHGFTSEACTRARAHYGLEPLPPAKPLKVVA